MSFTVYGTLLRAGEARTEGLGDAVLLLQIDAGGAHPVEVKRKFGPSPTDHLRCGALADTLRRGQAVYAIGGDIAFRIDHGTPCHVLRGVHSLRVDGRELF